MKQKTHQAFCTDAMPCPTAILNVCVVVIDLRQELAVRERTSDVRMSAPSSPTLDIDKTDSAVQASLSLPATPVGKNIEHPFIGQKGKHPMYTW